MQAQTRYLDAMFNVSAPETVTYANNISILTGTPTPTDLKMDVYQPVNDTAQLRPVVVTWHTGNFLPQVLNFSAYGDTKDSINVNLMRRVVSRGYVGISADYRKGWLPTADNQDVRTGTLLQAVYRASQDAHALARYLRKTVAEDGNPYRIDTSRIVYMGTGSGGYVVMAHATLDRIEEIATNPQFYDEDGNLLVDPAVLSNPQGTTQAQINIPNHVGYSSDVAMAVNIAGALGDSIWMEGKPNEPMILAYHSLTDPFAPYYAGTVIVPTTNQPVVDVAGSNLFIRRANALGLNADLEAANALTLDAKFGPLATKINQINAQYKQMQVKSPIPTATNDVFQYSRDNMFPFRYSRVVGAPYNYFNTDRLSQLVAGYNAAFPNDTRDVNVIVAGEAQTNPNYNNPAAANLVIDTIMAHFLPRAYIGLKLGDASTSIEEVMSNAAVGLDLYPNPTTGGFTVSVAENLRIRQIDVFDINGRNVARFTGLNQSSYNVERGDLPKGQYIVQLRLDEGTTARKVMLR
ncbi:T9SS type A sorting domain-containing protein [Neolewinella marina]|nr:T9SS type A sorting domain-containing protein [Neolewinella marina]